MKIEMDKTWVLIGIVSVLVGIGIVIGMMDYFRRDMIDLTRDLKAEIRITDASIQRIGSDIGAMKADLGAMKGDIGAVRSGMDTLLFGAQRRRFLGNRQC